MTKQVNKNETSALEIFTKHELAPALQTRILELDPKFAERAPEEQEEIVVLLLEQAQKTTEGVRSRFPLINIRHAGTNAIELPKKAGEEDAPIVREFEGIILDQYITKAYWTSPMGKGSGGPPDCASLNGITPYVKEPINPDGCVTCPFNKFGSGIDQDGNATRGKRCRDQKRVIVVLDEHDLPCRLMLSAMNIGPFDTYMMDLRDQGTPIGTVRTKFKAVSAKNKGGTEFTGIELNTVRRLSMDEILKLKHDVITPLGSDFRIGAIEANEGTSAAGPTQEDLARGTGEKAAGVL